MDYANYQSNRDAAWKILLDCGIDRLPVDLNRICRQLGVGVYRYADVCLPPDIVLEGDGFLYFEGDKPIILFDQEKPPVRIRFTIAHELGHLILGHVTPERDVDPDWEQRQIETVEADANQFAARLLAPACVLWGLGVHTAEEISRFCNISKQAAQVRAERMTILYQRKKFLTSPVERQIYEQFLPFIKEVRRTRPDE